jgi:peptidoglycan-associated lipoprotein
MNPHQFLHRVNKDTKMKKLSALLLVLVLAACSNKVVKDSPQVTAPINSQSASQAENVTTQDSSANTSSASQSSVSANPLTDPNNILSKRSVYFDFDKYNIKDEYKPIIAAHAQYLTANPTVNATLEGNADERGSREYNLALGQKRAVSVKSALNILGVSEKQLETVSYGKERANTDCNDETCWQKDRHTDIKYAGE